MATSNCLVTITTLFKIHFFMFYKRNTLYTFHAKTFFLFPSSTVKLHEKLLFILFLIWLYIKVFLGQNASLVLFIHPEIGFIVESLAMWDLYNAYMFINLIMSFSHSYIKPEMKAVMYRPFHHKYCFTEDCSLQTPQSEQKATVVSRKITNKSIWRHGNKLQVSLHKVQGSFYSSHTQLYRI